MSTQPQYDRKPPPYTPSPVPQPSGYVPPQQGYVPPQQGYAPPPPGFQQYYTEQPIPTTYGATHVTIEQPTTGVIIIGPTCPICRIGYLNDEFSCFGIFLAIFFFPIGILCCLFMREKRCNNCGAVL